MTDALTNRKGIQKSYQQQCDKIVARALGFDSKVLIDRIDESIARYEKECLNDGNCFENADSVLPSIGLNAELLAIVAAFDMKDAAFLSDALSVYVDFAYLHYRSLRCKTWLRSHERLYGIAMEDFGFAACAAIFLGADKQAKWLSEQFARHIDAKYKDDYSSDFDFLRTCRWIVGWYQSPISPSSDLPPPSGPHAGLNEVVVHPEKAPEIFDAIISRRSEISYNQIILNRYDESRFYVQPFSALFPFEVLASEKLIEQKFRQRLELDGSLLKVSKSIEFTESHRVAAFARVVEANLAKLEQENRLPT